MMAMGAGGGGRGLCHLGFSIVKFLALFDLQVTSIFPIKFRVNWFFGKEKKIKIDFQNGCHGDPLGFFME